MKRGVNGMLIALFTVFNSIPTQAGGEENNKHIYEQNGERVAKRVVHAGKIGVVLGLARYAFSARALKINGALMNAVASHVPLNVRWFKGAEWEAFNRVVQYQDGLLYRQYLQQGKAHYPYKSLNELTHKDIFGINCAFSGDRAVGFIDILLGGYDNERAAFIVYVYKSDAEKNKNILPDIEKTAKKQRLLRAVGGIVAGASAVGVFAGLDTVS